MQQQITGEHQIVIQPPLRNEIGQRATRVSGKHIGQPVTQGHNRKEQVNLTNVVAANRAESLEKYQPEDKVDAIIDQHPHNLADEAGPVLHCR